MSFFGQLIQVLRQLVAVESQRLDVERQQLEVLKKLLVPEPVIASLEFKLGTPIKQ